MKRYTTKQRDKAVNLIRSGKSYKAVSEKTGISIASLFKWAKSADVTRNKYEPSCSTTLDCFNADGSHAYEKKERTVRTKSTKSSDVKRLITLLIDRLESDARTTKCKQN